MKTKILFALLAICSAGIMLVSCSGEDENDIDSIDKQTILLFLPWSGSENSEGLYSAFLANIDSIESAIITQKGMSDSRLFVFLSESHSHSTLFEVTYSARQCQHNVVKTYDGTPYTTSAGITSILNDVKTAAPALNYAMIIGGHGCGWTYANDWVAYPIRNKRHEMSMSQGVQESQTTRFYGSLVDKNYATEIETLAEGIEQTGIKLQYLLFDDCYMANVETAYALRNATNYLVASTSEVLSRGMPYQTMWNYLAKPVPNYSSALSAFSKFYENYTIACGAMSAIDCRKIEDVAKIMKQINTSYTFAPSLVDSIQALDGFAPTIFFDFGDYVERLCPDNRLQREATSAIKSLVKTSVHTDSLYSALFVPVYFKVEKFSGITISDPSIHSVALKGREKTSWYQATH